MQQFFQGFLLGLAYVAPIGLQNLFVINTALTQSKRRTYLMALIIIFFDITLALACFFGIGLLLARLPWLEKTVLGLGSLIVIYIGIGLLRAKAEETGTADMSMSVPKLIVSACVVTWFNPQAIIDGTMMLGAFRTTLAPGQAGLFIGGVTTASACWFLGIATFILLFSHKFTPKLLRWINIVCGLIIIGYGGKLLYSFVQLMLG